MIKKKLIAFSLLFLTLNVYAQESFQSDISAIPEHIAKQMQPNTYRVGCPVSLSQLAYIRISYWGYDNKTHIGELIINKKIAQEVVTIFKELYEQKFPIERMELVDNYQGSDDASMENNNTSSFNCREKTGKPGTFSLHSYGEAIDINPLINPYVKGKKVYPPQGVIFLDRSKAFKGIITKDSLAYQSFIKRGWRWGGDWITRQDYQHFEKPETDALAGEM